MALAVVLTACSSLLGDTPTNTADVDATTESTGTTEPSAEECLRPSASDRAVDEGSVSRNALFLSGELFLCAPHVVVVDSSDINEVAVAAQLAAALGGPILFPDDRLAAEIGRLHPNHLHLIGDVQVNSPEGTDVQVHSQSEAVALIKETLAVTREVQLPATPDTSTIVETVNAIAGRDRVAAPSQQVSQVAATADIDEGDLIAGLAATHTASTTWVAQADDPVGVLMVSGTGNAVDAGPIALDGENILGHPEVGPPLSDSDMVKYVGSFPAEASWEMSLLTEGEELPGGGFVILPEQQRRYVAFYGHPETTALGVLGEQGGAATLERMEPLLDAYEGDGAQVVPTFEIIASVASGGPGDDGNYSYEWPDETFDDLLTTAEANEVYVLLDLQPGRSDFLTQARKYETLLSRPYVGLALDPEWRLGPDEFHLEQVGTVDAAEVNTVIEWLADLVREKGLPQKMLLLHMFRTSMITNRDILIDRPELQVVIQMDGDGTQSQKDATWAKLRDGYEDAFWSWGWKNFFDEDEPGPPSPEDTMSKQPTPVYVSYQ